MLWELLAPSLQLSGRVLLVRRRDERHAHSGSVRRKNFLHAVVPTGDALSRYVCGKDVRPLPRHRTARALLPRSPACLLTLILFRGQQYWLQFVCECPQPVPARAGTDVSGLCLRAADRATGVPFQFAGCRTGWLHSGRKRLRVAPSLYIFQTSIVLYERQVLYKLTRIHGLQQDSGSFYPLFSVSPYLRGGCSAFCRLERSPQSAAPYTILLSHFEEQNNSCNVMQAHIGAV